MRLIDNDAFHGCRELRVLSFAPDSRLEVIGADAFAWTVLEEFTAPTWLRTLSQEAFFGCGQLRRVLLNEGLETLGTGEENRFGERRCGAFQDSGVAEVLLPASLRKIGYCAFKGCAELKQIALPEGLRVVGEEAFARSGLEHVALPRDLREIREAAFYRCAVLSAVAVSEGCALEEVWALAFAGTGLAERPRLPAGARVAEDAFESSEDE